MSSEQPYQRFNPRPPLRVGATGGTTSRGSPPPPAGGGGRDSITIYHAAEDYVFQSSPTAEGGRDGANSAQVLLHMTGNTHSLRVVSCPLAP